METNLWFTVSMHLVIFWCLAKEKVEVVTVSYLCMFQLYCIFVAAYINIWLEQGFCCSYTCFISPDQHKIIVLSV